MLPKKKKSANAPTNLNSRASARAGCRRGSLRGRGSGQARSGSLIFSLIAGLWGEGVGPGLGTHIETPRPSRMPSCVTRELMACSRVSGQAGGNAPLGSMRAHARLSAIECTLLILGRMPVAHCTQTRKSPACRPRDPDSRSRDRDSRSRPNREAGDFPIPDSGRVGNRG
jgi:hypothetical protein